MQINDVIVRDLEWRKQEQPEILRMQYELPIQGVLQLVKESDPLLRRFGQIDFLKILNGTGVTIIRQRADEIWCVVDGCATFEMLDTRLDSPTYQAEYGISLEGDEPKILLIPFGVEFEVFCDMPSMLVRLTTHEDHTDPDDKTLSNQKVE